MVIGLAIANAALVDQGVRAGAGRDHFAPHSFPVPIRMDGLREMRGQGFHEKLLA
jgi:hypothetical protein